MAKKLSLREFQEYLAKRLTSAARGEISSALLGVQSGKESWLLNLADAGEILPVGALTPVPLTQPWFAGMANIRGNLYSVVDFSAFRGGEPTPVNANARLVLIGTRFDVNCALLVSRMLGLRPAEVLKPVADDGAPRPEWMNGKFQDAEGRHWWRLNVPGLIATPGFMQVGL
jgi:twitching motility protein PilI